MKMPKSLRIGLIWLNSELSCMFENREDPTIRQNSALGIVSPVDFENHIGLITGRKEIAA